MSNHLTGDWCGTPVLLGEGGYLELVLTSFLILLENFDEMLKTLLLFITTAV